MRGHMLNREKISQFCNKLGRIARGSQTSGGGLARAFRPTSAQALMEFALVSIPLLITMVGIFEFGLAYYDNTKLDSTTREFARRIAICSNGCDSYAVGNLTANGTTIPYDVAALRIIAATGYENPAALDATNINYIHVQRVGIDGTLSTTVTTTYRTNGGMVDANSVKGSDNQPLGYRPFYQHYVYSASANTTAPFRLLNHLEWQPQYLNSSQAPYNGRGFPSIGYDVTNGATIPADHQAGRNICEPTDRFYVEIEYKHNWVTPMGSLTGLQGNIALTRRIYGKIEPRFFGGGAPLVGVCT